MLHQPFFPTVYKVSMLGRLRKIMSPVMLNRIYLTYIQPSLDYAISVWGHCNQNFKKCVIRIQHRAARILPRISCLNLLME